MRTQLRRVLSPTARSCCICAVSIYLGLFLLLLNYYKNYKTKQKEAKTILQKEYTNELQKQYILYLMYFISLIQVVSIS